MISIESCTNESEPVINPDFHESQTEIYLTEKESYSYIKLLCNTKYKPPTDRFWNMFCRGESLKKVKHSTF